MGFHGPAVYLHAVHERTGWPLALISTAVTVHFLAGAIVVANLPALHRRFGIPAVTKAGAILPRGRRVRLGHRNGALAVVRRNAAQRRGLGDDGRGCDQRDRGALVRPRSPAALAMAYNGGNIGGVVFSPLWAAAIGAIGFPAAAAAIGLVMAITMWVLAETVFSLTPAQMQSPPDGDETRTVSITSSAAKPLPGSRLWRDAKFLTLAAGMALGLFAQIGLAVHLFSLLVPALGATPAGLAMGLVTAMAIVGRTLIGWAMPADADRRLVACASYAVQIAGCVAFIAADGTSVPLLLLGVVLFGAGFGNGTWLPPLIAQVEFAGDDVPRVVALIVAISQATYAFAPVVFGMIREFSHLRRTQAQALRRACLSSPQSCRGWRSLRFSRAGAILI